MDLRITEFLPQDELLAQLAEEASELGQAALKLRRILDGRNPTPTSYVQAVKNLNEEMADVRLCMDLITCKDDTVIAKFREEKESRWLGRLADLRRKEDVRKSAWPDD